MTGTDLARKKASTSQGKHKLAQVLQTSLHDPDALRERHISYGVVAYLDYAKRWQQVKDIAPLPPLTVRAR